MFFKRVLPLISCMNAHQNGGGSLPSLINGKWEELYCPELSLDATKHMEYRGNMHLKL